MGNKVLAIGLDGVSWELISRFVRDKKLPNIEKEFKQGVSAPFYSTYPISSASSWSKIVTGKNPGKHGLYEFMRRKKGSYDLMPLNSTHRQGKSIWDILGDNERRLCIINTPFTYPTPKKLNGIMITGMMTPPGVDDYTFPKDLKEEVDKRYEIDIKEVYKGNNEKGFYNDLMEVTNKRVDVGLDLMKKYEWDYFMFVFTGTDRIQHFFWKFIDENHPQHPKKNAQKYKEMFIGYFQRIDEYIGEFRKTAGDDANMILLSDHGMGNMNKRIHLNNLLRKQGMLKIKRSLIPQIKNTTYYAGFSPLNIFKLISKLKIKTKFKPTTADMDGILKAFFLSLDDVDWKRSIAYSTMGIGQIFLNLRGREPQGCVKEEDYETIREEVIGILKSCKDDDTGIRLFKNVFSRDDVYHGENLEDAPDILVEANEPYGLFTRYSFGHGKVLDMPQSISGTHRLEGFIALSGPDINPGSTIKNASVIDFLPTVLKLMNIPIPNDIDGRALYEKKSLYE